MVHLFHRSKNHTKQPEPKHVLGLGSLLSAEERDRLSALSDAAARRLAALPAA